MTGTTNRLGLKGVGAAARRDKGGVAVRMDMRDMA